MAPELLIASLTQPGFDRFDVFDRPVWHVLAACRGVGAAGFYPDRGASRGEELVAVRRMCDRCPVAVDCAATGWGENHGVWGGLSVK